MPLPSFFKRKPAAVAEKGRRKGAAAPAGDDGALVEAARTRARRRLIGAVVLLAIGIIVFPLVFETQPRPVALDTPIEVAGKARDAAALPASKPAEPAAAAASARIVAQAPPPQPIETEIEPAPKPVPAEPPKAEPAPKPVAEAPPPKPAASTPPSAAASMPKSEDGSRARALLEGKPASQPAASGRFVVQVGAYTDTQALREARQKVEKLGLKTYTQVVETDAGKRTRVRIGPFATREEADSAGARLKSAGLPANVLAL
jgi:DedD protein